MDGRRALLDALAEGPVDPDTLVADLGMEPEAVRAQVDALGEAGFGIDETAEGLVVADVPEFGGAAIEFGLGAPFDVEFHESHPSTNDRARELAAEGTSDVAVVAGEQPAGRGRRGRDWAGPPGGIYCSVLVRPDVEPAVAPVFTLAAGVAVARAAREAGVDAGIKWPNDVVVADPDADRGGRKLAGILTESAGGGDRLAWLVVGVGVNANVPAEALPPEATSLLEELGEPVERRVFAQRLLEEFHDLRGRPREVLDAWREHALTLGQRVRVETPGGVVEGEAVDVEFPGALVVETAAGTERVTAGDCEHLRPV